MRVFLYNVLFLAISLVIGAIAVEGFLRFDGRYSDLVNDNLVRTRAIWDRPANDTQYRKHPDLDYEVKIQFNDFGIRNHQVISLKDVQNYQGKLIGVFGDSFTENRRVNDEFSFTSLLNETLKPGYMVLNFGVDGYGLDQSYLKYLDFKERTRLNHVFYIFFANDLRNIYENQLFDFKGDKVGEPTDPRINLLIDFVRKFHISYLVLDSYARIKAKVSKDTYEPEKQNKKILSKYSQKQNGRKKRVHDEYADSITNDYLSDTPTEETLLWAKRFRMLLAAWKDEVQSHNTVFTIFVIPTQTTTDLAHKLFGKLYAENTTYLIDYFPEGFNNFTFNNDDHWNEWGNLRAAQAITDLGINAKYWPDPKNKLTVLTDRTKAAIEQQYQQ